MKRNFAIGVDYGTNCVRALIVDLADGTEIATAVKNYPSGDAGILLDRDRPTLARQSPRDYVECFYRVVAAAVREALDSNPNGDGRFDPSSVVGIGVDSTGSTPIPVDVDGIPLAFRSEFENDLAANAWLWKDHTAIDEAAAIADRASETHPEYLVKCGGTYSSEWYWAKIWRCLNESPRVFDAAYSWVELADFIPAFITGNTKPETLARGVCAAGHKAMRSADWNGLPSKEFLASLNPKLAPLRDRFAPTTKTSDQIAGYLTSEIAEKTGLIAGTPVAVGAFDCHMGAVGAGIRPGVLVKVVGTSSCDVAVRPLSEPLAELPGVCGIVPGSVLPDAFGIEAGQSAFGDVYRWFAQNFAPSEFTSNGSVFENLEREAAKLLPGESGLVALDWNNGNRCILVDQALTGAIVGTTLQTNAAETYRALVEATAFGSLRIVERLEEYGVNIDEIVVCGGVAEKSPTTMQILADVCDRPMKISRSSQTCALGAAIFGAVAGGAFANVREAQEKTTGFKEIVYRPDLRAVATYRRLYSLYRSLHDAFGVRNSQENLYRVMKELIEIRDGVRASKRR